MEGYSLEAGMKTITYNLNCADENSDMYYYEIASFTDDVLQQADGIFKPLVKLYMKHISQNSIEKLRTEKEYLFELISLGSYWRIYGSRALQLNTFMAKLLIWLYQLRRESKSIKPYVDYIRGILSTRFLAKEEKDGVRTSVPGLPEISKLLMWLESTGEYREEVKRLHLWFEFLSQKSVIDIRKVIKKLVEFAAWFEIKSEVVLDKYTPQVDEFHRTKLRDHKYKEDFVFCGRKKVEYFLSMFGAEVMNREFREEFLQTSRKAVLLPACMRINNGLNCKARQNSLDLVCTGCSRDCRINQITKLGKNSGFEVHIIPHSSSFTKWLETWGANKGIGVVGVACPLNLITGGLEMRGLNIAAQCVLLDYCGCTNHWDKDGIETDINRNELLRLLETENKDVALAV